MPATDERGENPPLAISICNGDRADLEAIHGALDRLRPILPPDPYLLTIPQEVEPKHRYRHAYEYQKVQWLHQAPFQPREGEMVQYQTFVYHEHGKDMYVLHNSLPREEREEGAGAKGRPSTGANTPNAGPKKKISLDAYKKAKTNGSTSARDGSPARQSDAALKKPAVKGPVERVKAETDEVLAAIATEPEPKTTPSETHSENGVGKRKRKESTQPQQKHCERAAGDEEPATKRARTGSPPPPSSRKDAQSERRAESIPPSVPPLKATTPALASEDTALPPRLSPLQAASMPSRLSPTIPTNITETLRAREQLRPSTSDSAVPNLASRNGKLTPLAKSDSITKRKSPVPRNGFRANSSSPVVRSDADDRVKPFASFAPLSAKDPAPSKDDKENGKKVLKARRAEQDSLMVKLKYKKSQKDDIRRILGMRSQPKTTSGSTPQPSSTSMPHSAAASTPKAVEDAKAERSLARRRDPNAKGVAQKVGPVARGVAQKVGPVAENVAKTSVENKPSSDESMAKPASVTGMKSGSEKGAAGAADAEKKPSVDGFKKKTREGNLSVGADQQHLANDADSSIKEKTSASGASVRADTAQEAANSRVSKTDPLGTRTKRKAEQSQDLSGETNEQAAKRKRIPNGIDTKKGPSTPDMQSPSLPGSIQKSLQVTPSIRKDHVSMAMQREPSADSNVNTPLGKSNTPTADRTSTSQPNGIIRPHSSQPSSKTSKQQLWEAEQKRLETQGRELKHAATAHLNSLKVSASKTAEQKLAAVKSLESLLCYFLAFTSADEAASAADPKQTPSIKIWCSLQGFFNFVKRNTEPFPLLQGLACHLGVVFNARIIDMMLKFPAERPARDITLDVYAPLAKHASDAETKLDIDALQDSFPRSWQRRVKGKLTIGKLAAPADCAGDYKLPIGISTTPLCAARAAYSMLGEWIERDGMDYDMKLKL
ncbi:hypothetical protein B0A50_05410 [Salinomyces thailandicus]|uniref:Uncharacterized protein n=1 Tax=Salinomyces thailandicus TaxID=706561 RepID=A0A4V5N428_9PEZI|nr:hypothetical protein B0A50_05410 [Salinomyces thailandica]